MKYRSCVIVLIGSQTAGRKWINYEIEKGWSEGKGVVGIYIHGLKDRNGKQANKGANPFDLVKVDVSIQDWWDRRQVEKRYLSTIIKAYDPPLYDSQRVYDYIRQNLADWIEEAIRIRQRY